MPQRVNIYFLLRCSSASRIFKIRTLTKKPTLILLSNKYFHASLMTSLTIGLTVSSMNINIGHASVNVSVDDTSTATIMATNYEATLSTLPIAIMEPIVVTGTRSQKLLSNAPIPVQVLDSQTLQDNHAHTLKEALDLLPNIYLTPLHGKTGYEVRMQGFNGDQVLVLIDGLPISASTGSTVNLAQYLNTNVAQIEIIQGAASAQYGSSAMGGVINVITNPIENEGQGHITAELGTNGDQNPSDDWLDNNLSFIEGGVEGALTDDGRLKARLSGSYLDDAGLSVDNDAWPRLKDASMQRQINTRISYIPNINEVDSTNPSTQLWLEAGYYDEEDTGRFNYYVPPVNLPQQRNENITRTRLSFGGQTRFSGDSLPFIGVNNTTINTNLNNNTDALAIVYPSDSYRLSGEFLYEDYDSESNTYSYNTNSYQPNNSSSAQPSRTLTSGRDTNITTYLAQAQLDLPLINLGEAQTHAVQLGTKWQQDELNQFKNNVSELIADDVERDVIEAYVQDDWMIGDNLEVVIGARYQDDSDFGDHFAPKIAIKNNFYDDSDRRHTLRASVGEGYRVPNLKERYFVFDHSNLGYKVMGNPNLVPEESTSYQVGYETALTDTLALTVNGFYNDIESLIQTDNNNLVYDGPITIYRYGNVENATTYGADVALQWQANDKTRFHFGYAYLNTENEATGSELTLSPEHKVTANIEYQVTPKLQLIQWIKYESEQLVNTQTQQYSPEWWGLDSRINYTLNPNVDVYAAVNNVLNEQRDAGDATDQRPIDNRQWRIGASYHW